MDILDVVTSPDVLPRSDFDFSASVKQEVTQLIGQYELSPEQAFQPIEDAWENLNVFINNNWVKTKDYIATKKRYLEIIESFVEVHYVNAQFFRRDEPHIITRLKNLRNKVQNISNNHLWYEIRDLERYGISPQFLPRPIWREPHYGTFIVEFPNK